ncbi:ATPase, histidine kinase-, DNA gyrase B-, and HSP90-like domain protein [Synechococcus sp. PCC 7335]|uniref:sensor histidine kinase n=1 Tax=Synechococcus sp. (strain ATCC 29403 / PCC 7335) TaxID=91464 RepID=UPI00017EB0FD|nr:HAMP domain-containing sensor histidine kinase [Synechococcus sp. PCC 7335]EDX85061.1 ATPase, histidine kinase-, DNA gyrase B-, and HSP90-like domain protein [Synechococcus sp. PCC 7335]
MDFGQLLAQRKRAIIDTWMTQVRGDNHIESSQDLTYEAILDSLPNLLDAIAHLLRDPQLSDVRAAIDQADVHGEMRAKQGYSAGEIVREYGILRGIIFDELEAKLLTSDTRLTLRATRLIDGVLDKTIAFCLDRYTDERLREVKWLYDEMMVSNQELDRLARNEQRNMAYLAHELKSPLSCIIGYSDLFLRQQSSHTKPNFDFIEQVLANGRRLLTMINETLEISYCRSGQMAIKLEQVDLSSLIEEVATVLSTLAQQKALSIEVDCQADIEPMTTDQTRLRQVLTNLISNAVRYTEEGSIKVKTRLVRGRENNLVEVAVIDSGLGIDSAEQDRIFEPYYQGEAGQRAASSTGLGLAIARQLVELLQGSIRLTSEPNVGSTFTIVLPLHYSTGAQLKTQTEAISGSKMHS